VKLNYDYMCDINVCETVMFIRLCVYTDLSTECVKATAREKQAYYDIYYFITELYVAKLIRLIRAVIKQSLCRRPFIKLHIVLRYTAPGPQKMFARTD